MSRNERAEGLEIARVFALVIRRPRQEMYGPVLNGEHRLPWRAAMRLEVAAWESGFFWRRTDDEHSTCVLRRIECSAEVLFCGHYVLGVCTDETSAHKPTTQVPARCCAASAGPWSRLLFGRGPWNQYRSTAAYAKDFFKEETAPGLAATTPSFCCHDCRSSARNHAVSVRRNISGRTRPTSRRLLPASRLLVVRDRPDSQGQGSGSRRPKARSRKYGIDLTERATGLSQAARPRQHAIHPLRRLVPAPGHGRPSPVQATGTKSNPRLPPTPDQVRGLLDQLPPQRHHADRRRPAEMARMRPDRPANLQTAQSLLSGSGVSSLGRQPRGGFRTSAVCPLRPNQEAASYHPPGGQRRAFAHRLLPDPEFGSEATPNDCAAVK